MRITHALLGTGATLALTALLTAPQALAADSTASVRAAAPTVSGPVTVDFIHNVSGLLSCPYTYLCTSTWDPTKNSYKIYKFKQCGTYSLSNWEGDGGYINNQTPGTTALFLTEGGAVYRSAPADNKSHPISWGPVWKIKPC